MTVLRKGKVHARSVRLFNNAGMDFPLCMAYHRLLPVHVRARTTVYVADITCKNCIAALARGSR